MACPSVQIEKRWFILVREDVATDEIGIEGDDTEKVLVSLILHNGWLKHFELRNNDLSPFLQIESLSMYFLTGQICGAFC